jgi:hypothetical protein
MDYYRFAAYGASGLLLLVLFCALPLSLRDVKNSPRLNIATLGNTAQLGWQPAAAQFLLDEHKKATDEIKLRIEHGDAWFYRKFVMIGGLLAAFIAALSSKAFDAMYPSPGADPLQQRYDYLVNSNATCTVLALAMAVAVSIDIHTKVSDSAVHQIALWITHYVEPAFLGDQKIGYETYLRGPGGQHDNPLMTFVLRPYGYFLTWAIYLLYLTCFYKVCSRARKTRTEGELGLSDSQQRLALVGFLLVHFCLGAFAVVSHSAPPAYDLHLFFHLSPGEPGYENWTFAGDKCGWRFLIPFGGLVALHLPCVLRLFRGGFGAPVAGGI